MKPLISICLTMLLFVAGPIAICAQEVIVDNDSPGFSILAGSWTTGTAAAGKYGADYRFATVNSDPVAVAQWEATLPQPGVYRVETWYPQSSNRSNTAPFTVFTGAASHNVSINQQQSGGTWVSLGRYHFPGVVGQVQLNNTATSTVVMADAVRFAYDPPREEIRSLWASRFEWPNFSETTTKANIDNIMSKTAQHNFNTIFFQIRGQMDTLYPSPDEPWTSTYNWQDPVEEQVGVSFDPTAYAIDKAHEHGLEFHAYINTHTMSSPVPPANTVPQHIYHRHGPGAPLGAERWDIHNQSGNPQGQHDSYVWVSPGVPNASAWTRKQVMYIAQNYDVDGLHFDRIRTPGGPGIEFSYDPMSIARFNGEGNPDKLTSYSEFMRDQIRRDMRLIYGEVQYHKPHVQISAAPFGIMYRDWTTQYQSDGTYAWHTWTQDAFSWLQNHSMDFMVPQIYWEINSQFPYEKLLADWVAKSGGRWVVPGSRTGKTIASQGYKPVAGLMGELLESRNQNAAGHCVFSFGALNRIPTGDSMSYWDAYLTGPHDLPTTAPKMPWKTNPTTGFITGYILDENGQPVTDARVNLDGVDYNHLSAADGFFSILDVAPGANFVVRAIKNHKGSLVSSPMAVAAGEVTSVTLKLNPQRGFVAFDAPVYDFENVAGLRLFDEGLVGQFTAQVNVASPAEPAGEIITLTGTGDGLFTGSVELYTTTSAVGVDGRVAVYPGVEITATYSDSNDGNGAAVYTETSDVRVPEPVIVESRTLTGAVTPDHLYNEIGTGWSNSALGGTNSEHTKSFAPGTTGRGIRSTSETITSVRFTPPLAASGFYDVYVTLPAAPRGTTMISPGAEWIITHAGGISSGVFDYSHSNPALANNWFKVGETVELYPNRGYNLEIKNNHAGTSATQRFAADAVRFVFAQPVPVVVSEFAVE